MSRSNSVKKSSPHDSLDIMVTHETLAVRRAQQQAKAVRAMLAGLVLVVDLLSLVLRQPITRGWKDHAGDLAAITT